jgi:hypothetical protein
MFRHFTFYILLGATLLAGCGNDNTGNPVPPTSTPEPEPATCSGTEINPERLYLQQLSADSLIIKWRGNLDGGDEANRVCFGTAAEGLLEESETMATVTATGHSEALITALEANTTYFYSVGGAENADTRRSFRTAPAAGDLPTDGNIRIWLLGDSGTATGGGPEAEEVRDGYRSYIESSGGEPADLVLLLGDNAYGEGTDQQFQVALFDLYTDELLSAGLWTTIGNHEMGSLGGSTSADPGTYTALLPAGETEGPDPATDSPMPYLNIFTLPTAGEAGGLASGTEQYYSFDYGNLHVVSLDSQLASRDETQRATMLQWVTDDLMANSSDWTIVIFHHPPYTKGSHDSDSNGGGIDQPIIDFREEFTPVFDQFGVDLVYSGHSHIYERSYYLNGHTGLSDTFDPLVHAELNAQNEPASGQGDEAYTQITSSGTDDKVVYTVAGSAGQATSVSATFPHPAHFFSLLALGSVVVDLDGSTLKASFIDIHGEVLDSFTMTR